MELANKGKHVELTPQRRVQQKGIKISSGNTVLITSKLVVQPDGRCESRERFLTFGPDQDER
jgi:hypothetical protein